jgi:hypothetical protein
MTSHDQAYKQLFSHPRLVRDLITGFVPEYRRAPMRLSPLSKANAHFISDHLKMRSSDTVWRIRVGGRDYIYLLLEFQSTIEHFMALRVLTYVGLLYQDVIKAHQHRNASLPPVIPIVLYHGNRRWNAPRSLDRLLRTHSTLSKPFRANVRYKLIDVRRQRLDTSNLKRNLVAALFRIENSRTRREVRGHMALLLGLLKGRHDASLRRAFSVWINKVVLARLPGGSLDGNLNLEEMHSMLDDRFAQWEKEIRAAGRRDAERSGKADLLMAQLSGRFGQELPGWVQRRVQQATSAQLKRWGIRLLSTESLDELFRRQRRTAQ